MPNTWLRLSCVLILSMKNGECGSTTGLLVTEMWSSLLLLMKRTLCMRYAGWWVLRICWTADPHHRLVLVFGIGYVGMCCRSRIMRCCYCSFRSLLNWCSLAPRKSNSTNCRTDAFGSWHFGSWHMWQCIRIFFLDDVFDSGLVEVTCDWDQSSSERLVARLCVECRMFTGWPTFFKFSHILLPTSSPLNWVVDEYFYVRIF